MTNQSHQPPEEQPTDITIIVNGRPKDVDKAVLTYDEVVRLAFPNPHSEPHWVYAITYEKGPLSNPEGTLVAGEEVRVKKGMVFNVTETDKS